jgi:hypothetical protein
MKRVSCRWIFLIFEVLAEGTDFAQRRRDQWRNAVAKSGVHLSEAEPADLYPHSSY